MISPVRKYLRASGFKEEAHTISRKIGRPLKAETRLSHDVKVRFDDETYDKLCLYCERQGKEKASVLREALRKYLEETEDFKA